MGNMIELLASLIEYINGNCGDDRDICELSIALQSVAPGERVWKLALDFNTGAHEEILMKQTDD